MITRKIIRTLPHLAGVALTSVMVSAGRQSRHDRFQLRREYCLLIAPVTGVYDIEALGAQGGVNAGISGPSGCVFRGKSATDSDLISAIPI